MDKDLMQSMHLCWEYRPERFSKDPKNLWRLRFVRLWKSSSGTKREIASTEFYVDKKKADERVKWIKSEGHKKLSLKRYDLA